ncbi:MAG: hypothetical protein SCH71_00700 [Desulfobulbaceae bacterium]|nr:hypothetical protein [Desulfobulbaceae bacterium]
MSFLIKTILALAFVFFLIGNSRACETADEEFIVVYGSTFSVGTHYSCS